MKLPIEPQVGVLPEDCVLGIPAVLTSSLQQKTESE